MINDEFFKQLQFTKSSNMDESERVWIRQLDKIQHYLKTQSFPEQEDILLPDDFRGEKSAQHQLRFKLAFDSTYHDPDAIPKITAALYLYEALDEVTLHPIHTREALDILYIESHRKNKQLSDLDNAWLDFFKSYFYPNANGEYRIVLPSATEIPILETLCHQQLLLYFDLTPNQCEWLKTRHPFQFMLTLKKHDEAWKLWGILVDESGNQMDLWDIQTITTGGIARQNERIFAYETSAYPWIETLLTRGAMRIPDHALSDCLYRLLSLIDLKFIHWPENILIQSSMTPLQPIFYIKTKNDKKSFKMHIEGFAWFRAGNYEYESDTHHDLSAPARPKVLGVQVEKHHNNYLVSVQVPDIAMERVRLEEVNACPGIEWHVFRALFQIKSTQAIDTFYYLLHQGWEVWAENLQIKILKEMQIQLTTHANWFEVDLMAGNPAHKIPAWQLIHLLKKQRLFIQLSDGSLGLLPEAWYQTFSRLFSLRCPGSSAENEDGLRFSKAHAVQFAQLADMAASSNEVHFTADHAFEEIRHEILNMNGLQPMQPAPSFQLTLRPYQEIGLSWLHFLGRTQLGGCLADDMGLGKTIQVLAYLDLKRHESKKKNKFTSLLVSPRSLLEHWQQEARKCAPRLKVAILRACDIPHLESLFDAYDLLLISYGLVRQHAQVLQQYPFDLLALDEAQLIKNAEAQTTLAINQLQGIQRLAISGTPIENHIGELFSLFEFLNPGLTHSAFLKSASSALADDIEKNAMLEQFLQGIRPLILRRLKTDVAKELPEKSEHTLTLPMEEQQEAIYISLKNYYQEQLKNHETNRFYDKFFFLEGLLRLRQAACHPLLFENAISEQSNAIVSSNKFAFLIEKLKTLVNGDHKAIIFSQFTSLLKLFQNELEALDIPYAYLDGQSQDRLDIVTRFQTSAHIPVLLASIKTGGLGFNLTAADYCFILDPWWNPAIEQQAVDRIHRIGQEKKVTIYRIVSQNTVEEKMLLLKEKKQKIADQLMTADHSFLEQLNFDDFQFLLQLDE